jgi:hypothetical protein
MMISHRRRCFLGLALPWLWFSASNAADKPATFRNATWEELVPKDWDPLKHLREQNPDRIREGDAKELALMREMRELWDNAPTRSELNGANIRLPGYVVPLEQSRGEVKEFLLVPYFGACIHSPPPPANQIVHVVLSTPKPLRTMEAVWASGTLRTRRQDSPWGMSGYSLEGMVIELYKPAGRWRSAHLAIDVVPAAMLAHESAGLVHPLGPAAELAAGHELYRRVAGILSRMAAHFQPQPTQTSRMWFQHGGAGAGVPGVEQVAGEAAHIGAVSRSHEGLGVRRLQVKRAGVVATAAVGIRAGAAAIAARARFSRTHG